MRSSPLRMFLVLALALGFLNACSDDDGGTGPGGGDTLAPFVLSTTPQADETQVAVDASLRVTFNEAMDPATVIPANVTLTPGGVDSLLLVEDEILEIAHPDWPEGTEVTLTVGAGLTDTAGNGLESPFTLRFWTTSSAVELLATIPSDGATDVNRSEPVQLLFSRSMDLTSLQTAISVTGAGLADPIPFTVEDGDNGWVRIRFADPLPASTAITVDISTAAQANGGQPLAAAASFTFTTGTATDTTAPTIVSVEPTGSGSISPDTPFLRFTFSEAIDPDTFSPAMISAQLLLLMEYHQIEPVFSSDGTVMTVPLPTPLPPGLRLVARFESYSDLAGNVQTSPYELDLTVSGTPDPWPFVDGAWWSYFIEWTEGDAGGVTANGTSVRVDRFEAQAGGDFRLVEYPGVDFTVASEGWRVFRRSPSTIVFTGFREVDGPEVTDIDLVPDVTWLRLPVSAQSWNGQTSATVGGATQTIDYIITIGGPEDRVLGSGMGSTRAWIRKGVATQIVWVDAWKQELQYQFSSGGINGDSGTDTTWFVAGLGPIQASSREDSPDGTWSESTEDLEILDLPGGPYEAPEFFKRQAQH